MTRSIFSLRTLSKVGTIAIVVTTVFLGAFLYTQHTVFAQELEEQSLFSSIVNLFGIDVAKNAWNSVFGRIPSGTQVAQVAVSGSSDISDYTNQRAKYIDQSCQYNGDGLSNSCATSQGGRGKFNELQSALDSLVSGDTLYVYPGMYWRNPGSGTIYRVNRAATADRPIIVTAYDTNNRPVLYSRDPSGNSTYASWAIVAGDASNYVIFDNLVIRGGAALWGGGPGSGMAQNSVMQNIDCSGGFGLCDGNWACLRVEWCEDCWVHHNYVHDVEDNGYCSGSSDPREAGLKEFTSEGTIWEFNTVRNTVRWGFDLHRDSVDTTVRYNVFENAGNDAVIRMTSSANRNMYGNIINGGGQCIRLIHGADDASNLGTDRIYNNTCANTYRAIDITDNVPTVIKNNVIYRVDPQRIEGGNISAPGTLHTIDYNAYDANGYFHNGLYLSLSYDSLSSWQTVTGYDAHSREGSGSYCSFVNPPTSATDYSYNLEVTGNCLTASDTGGEVGAYGLVDCVGYTCGDTSVSTPPAPDPEPTPAPTVTFTASPTSLTSGQASTLTWSSTNTTSCTASGAWSGTKSISGTQSVSPTNTGTYTLSCTGSGGSASRNITLTVTQTQADPTPAPTVSFSASLSSITEGQSSTLTWTSTNATACTASGAWSGSKNTSGTQSVSPTNTGTYTLTCTGDGGSASRSVSITVSSAETPAPPAPTITFTASPTSLTSGQTSTLTWSSTNTTSCAASNTWGGLKSTQGSQTVSPTVTSTYLLACTGSGGTVTDTVTISVTTSGTTKSPSDDGTKQNEQDTNPEETKNTTRQTTKRTEKNWIHTISPDKGSMTVSNASSYKKPYFTYRGIEASLMKAYKADNMIILVAGSGSRLQKMDTQASYYKDGEWHTVPFTGIWPKNSDGTYTGRAYYILRSSDPLYSEEGAFAIRMQMNLPGCDNPTCAIDDVVLQEFKVE